MAYTTDAPTNRDGLLICMASNQLSLLQGLRKVSLQISKKIWPSEKSEKNSAFLHAIFFAADKRMKYSNSFLKNLIILKKHCEKWA
jgi:hypothetical protein